MLRYPFIARYRKEATGGLDELDVSNIKSGLKKYKDLVSRKETIIESIAEQKKLSPELKSKIEACWDSAALEDLYLPFKKRRKTRADKAREQGLEGLAKIIMAQREQDLHYAANKYTNKEITSSKEALAGARDIIAEWVSENVKVRDIIRQAFNKYAVLTSKVKKLRDEEKKEKANLYRDYFDYSSRLSRTPSHRLLAIRRAEREGYLNVSIDVDVDNSLDRIDRFYVKSIGDSAEQIRMSIDDSYKRLIKPSIENEFAKKSKEIADKEAISVFTKNLSNLLLEAPLGEKVVMAIDPRISYWMQSSDIR